MSLPASMQARKTALESEQGTPTPTPTPVETPNPNDASAESRVQGESVTISREEFNQLQAAAGRVRAAEGRTESLEMDLEALQARLTALETAAKGSTHAPAPTDEAEDWQPAQVSFTDQENADYGESRAFVEKVVLETLNKVLPKALGSVKGLKGKLKEIETAVSATAQQTQALDGQGFTEKVREKVGNFDEVVNHQHWRAFAESEDPYTGMSYADTIRLGIQNRKLDVVVRAFEDFKTKYNVGKKPASTGYEGAIPSGGSKVPEGNDKPEMLPFSKRKEAHKKWINKEISDAEYQRIRDDYDKAEKEGRLDYNA